MRSLALRIFLCLFAGVLLTISQTWAFAIWADARLDRIEVLSHASGMSWQVHCMHALGMTRVSRVPDNGEWGSLGTPAFDDSKIPYWSRSNDSPSVEVFNDPSMPWSVEYASGWPWRSGWAEVRRSIRLPNGQPNPSNRFMAVSGREVLDDGTGNPMPFRVLPMSPIVPGLLGNAAIASTLVALVMFGPAALRRLHRRRRGRCTRCGYDLRSNPMTGCPECGAGRV